MSKELRTAIYMRLSKEDAYAAGIPAGSGPFTDDSNSIRMQRILLMNYVSSHFENYRILEFKDDGYSGTNFDRPGIKELLRLSRESEIDCIIVKDFSRFSRDYIELGSYIDHIFPFMGIRFISVNDHYDSAGDQEMTGNLEIAFQMLMYDLYSRDLSVKVKSALTAEKEKGRYISAYSPFGYEKAPEDRHMLLIEEEEAAVVRKIFKLTLDGKTSTEIARMFNQEGIKTPLQFQIQKGKTGRSPKKGRFIWSSSGICKILGNEIYTGDIVYGKYVKDGAGGKNHIRPRSEWKVAHNHHEPIIDRETFEQVKDTRRLAGKKTAHGKHPLTGKLVCGCCGRNLYLRNKVTPYFECPNLYTCGRKEDCKEQEAQEDYEEHARSECCVRKAEAILLEQYVLLAIHKRLQERTDKDELKRQAEKTGKERLRELGRQERAICSEIKKKEKQREEAYESYALNKSTAKMFRELSDGIRREIIRLKDRKEKIQEEVERLREIMSGELTFSELMEFFGLDKLTGEAVEYFAERIIVFNGQDAEIYWKC